MADRIDLLVSLGALLKDAQRRGDADAVQTLHDAMEAIVEAQGVVSVLERRRKSDRDRKRGARSPDSRASAPSVESSESMEVGGIRGNGGPPSPQVSSSSPEPLITPSSPSSPASSSSSPAADDAVTPEERAFFAEVDSPVLATAAQRFLAGKQSTARIAWVGRFRGAMSRPPHPTVAELHDALEDLMANEPPANWVPTLFRTYVGRIRRDAAREAERNAAPPSRNGQRSAAGSDTPNDAGTMFARIREFVQISDPVPGQPRRRFIRRTDVEQLGERVLRAYDEIGGADRFTDPDEKVGFVLRDFTKALGTLNGAHP